MATVVSLNTTVSISLAVGDDCYIESTGGYAAITVTPVYQGSDVWRVGPSKWRRRFGPYPRRAVVEIANTNAAISYTTTVDTVGGAPTGSQIVAALDTELGGTTWQGGGGGSGDMVLATAQAVTGAKTFGDTKLIIAGATSGNTTLKASDGAGDISVTLPAIGPTTLVGRSTTDTLTNKTLTSPVLGGTVTGTYTLGGTPTFPAAVVTLTGTQTLTNKTLTAPTLTTPALGTPASGNLSNCTAVPAAQISGVIPIANLATGTPTGSKFIRDDGTLQAIAGGGDALVGNPLSQFAATTSAQLAGVVSDETGSGALVFATSPTLVTPALGTPSAAVLTNATGLPVSTGVSGLGTGVAAFLATPSSANLAAAVTGETGSGALVFGTAPTISALTATGITTYDGANVTTANAMGALSIDTTKGLNTKSVSADSTFTFSAQPATDTWFSLYVANTDTAPHILTIPSCFSMVTQGNRTTMPIAASGQLYLVFRHSGSGNYKVLGDSAYFNKYDATAAPGVGDDVADGYGPGSLWYDATGNALYICESNGAGAAVWTALAGGAGDVTLTGTQTLTNKQVHLAAVPGTDDTYQGIAITGRNAGATIAQWEAVYLGSGGTWLLADADGSSTQPARGLAVSAYTSGNAAVVLDNGVARNDAWAWTVGGDIYLSTTAGGLTQTAPVVGFVQKLGYALSADSMRVAIGSAELLGL